MRHAHVALAAIIAIASCGDSSFPIEILGDQARDAYCERAVRCGLFRDTNACAFELSFRDGVVTPRVRQFQDPGLVAAVKAGTLKYDESKAPACIAALAALSCNRASEDDRVDPPACAAMFTGLVAGSGACAFDDECASGRCTPAAICPDDYTCCPGTCASAPHTAAIGSACAIDSDCATDAFCSGAGCHELIGSGESCSTSTQCDFGMICVGPVGQGGECQLAPLIGEACVNNQCAEVGAWCDGSACAPLGLPGQPCASDVDCGEDEVCSGSGSAAVCARAPGLGEPCQQICLPGSWCTGDGSGGTCVAPLGNGSACEAPQQCQSDYCADGEFATTCIAKLVCI